MGFIINKAIDIDVNDVLRQCDLPLIEKPKPALWGGPVGSGAVFVLVKGVLPNGEGWTIEQQDDPISVGISLSLIQKQIEEKSKSCWTDFVPTKKKVVDVKIGLNISLSFAANRPAERPSLPKRGAFREHFFLFLFRLQASLKEQSSTWNCVDVNNSNGLINTSHIL